MDIPGICLKIRKEVILVISFVGVHFRIHQYWSLSSGLSRRSGEILHLCLPIQVGLELRELICPLIQVENSMRLARKDV